MKYCVTIDARWFRTGLGTYVRNLLSGLSRFHEELEIRAIVNQESAEPVSRYCRSQIKIDARGYSLREQIQVPMAARSCDLLHIPHYNLPLLHQGKLVVSIHDLIHVTPVGNPGLLERTYAHFMLKSAVWKANRVITVSEYSKRELCSRLEVPEAKVCVIPNGVADEFHLRDHDRAQAIVADRLSHGRRYFLCVSSLRQHKNLTSLLRAAALFWRATGSDWDLIIVGSGPEGDPLRSQCKLLGIDSRVHWVSFVEQEMLPDLYAGAQFFAMPSLVEGFGLPVLEAMACGTPVVCSHSASLPEVAGVAALYFDPTNVEEMAATLKTVAQPETALWLRAKGLEHVKHFSWKTSVGRHYDLYREVLRDPPRRLFHTASATLFHNAA